MVTVNHYRWRCTDCEQAGWPGYCAPLRCYCGHETCHAFASWTPLAPLNIPISKNTTAHASSWANREEGSSWIDQL